MWTARERGSVKNLELLTRGEGDGIKFEYARFQRIYVGINKD